MDADPWPEFDDVFAASAAVGSEKPPVLVYGEDAVVKPVRVHGRVRVALFAFVAGVVVVTAAVLVLELGRPEPVSLPSARTETVTAAPTSLPTEQPVAVPTFQTPTASVATLAPPSPPAVLEDRDAVYLSLIAQAGLTMKSAAGAIADGHSVCEYLSQGHSVAEAIANDLAHNATMAPRGAHDFIYAAIDAYCPGFENRGEY